MNNKKLPIKFTRDLLLYLVFSLKTVPLRWVYNLADEYSIERKNLTAHVSQSLRAGLMTIQTEASGDKFLFMTLKGYNRVSESLSANYSYTHWSRRANRAGTISQEHHYLSFRFLLDYLLDDVNRTVTHILTDYDKESTFHFNYDGQNHTITPDAVIRTESMLLALESDTGTEVVRKIYDKVLKYAIMMYEGTNLLPDTPLHLYFTFKSANRLQSLFPEDFSQSVIFPMLHPSICKLTEAGRRSEFPTENLVRLLQDNRLVLFAGQYNQGFGGYKQVNLLTSLLSLQVSKGSYLDF